MNQRASNGGFRRTIATGVVAFVAVVGSMAAGGGEAGARVAAPTAPAQAPPNIDPGRASARANVISVAPTSGTLQFALGGGQAIAETVGGLSQAQAQAADLGLIGSSLTSEKCDGSDPSFSPEDLPSPLVVDNRGGAHSAEEAEAPTGVPGTAAGTKRVEADDTPSSRAVVSFVESTFAPVFDVAGGEARSEAEVFPGAGREARAAVSFDVNILDTVRLGDLRWTARHRTGGEDGAEGAFTIGAVEIVGIPVPAETTEQAVAAANTALAALGLRLEMPEVLHITEPVDLVRVTPMRLVFADAPVSELLVRPALEATQLARAQMFDALVAITCRFSEILLVGEIGIGIAAGTGQLIAEFGGVEATSADVVIENLFGTVGGLLPPADTLAAVDLPTDAAGAPVAGRPATVPAATGAVPVAAAPAASTAGPFDRICENVHPNRKPSCSEGSAAAVGLAGLAATAAVGALDLRRRRRPAVGDLPAVSS